MEENIKILEGYLDRNTQLFEDYGENAIIQDKEIQALENLLQGYKELEEERELVGMPVKNKIDGKIGIVLHQWESGSIAVLEKISPRVINTHDSWNTLEIITDTVVPQTTKDDYIPKSKVKEMLKELFKKLDEPNNDRWEKDDDIYYNKIKAQIRIIQELMED